MSLEQALNENTAAIGALTATLNAALKAGVVAAPTGEPAKPAKAPAPAEKVKAATTKPTPDQIKKDAQAPVEKQVTQADIQAAGADLTKLADMDRAAAVGILQEFGVGKMTAAKPEQIPQIHAKVRAKIAELEGGEGETSLV